MAEPENALLPAPPPQAGAPAGENEKFMSWPWLVQGLNDWINLLGNPDPVMFKCPPNFEWPRLMGLVVVVLGFCGAVLGTALIVLKGHLSDMVFQRAPSVVLIFGAVLAIGYSTVGSLFGVQISLRDAFFTILLLGLPWLSLTAGIYIAVKTFPATFMGLVLFVWLWLTPILLTRNLCRGIAMVAPGAKRWRVRCSVIVSVVLLIAPFVIVWMFAEVPG